MRPMVYRRLASPLHAARAGVAALWTGALLAAAVLLSQPVALATLVAATLAAGAMAGVGRELARSLRTCVVLALPIVVVNVLVSREGLTVFARLGDLGPLGQGDLTVEALVYGAVIAVRVTAIILLSALASTAIDPDELLRISRRVSFRSALTASLTLRMLPLLNRDARRLAEAQRTRPGGGAGQVSSRLRVLAAVVSGSLDRAMDVATTLEVRGLALAPRAPRQRRPWSRHDLAFAASAAGTLALALTARLDDLAPFSAYPTLHAPLTPGALAVCAALATVALLPFADRRGIEP